MNSVTRTFGKLMHRSPGDNARVSMILKDYEDVDRLLAKLIDEARALRDSWHGMVTSQLGTATEYCTLYDPIAAASDGHGRVAQPTPELQLLRTFQLRTVYEEIKEEMMEEISALETGVINPGTSARDFIQPMRKTIKKRENKRLDYEKCQDKVKKLQRKPGKSVKEDAQMHKLEDELTRLSEEFQIADDHLRDSLPPIISAVFNLVPPLLAQIVSIQNRLLGLSYTAIHQYCEDHEFPSPPPAMEIVVADWDAAFNPIQKEIESFSIVKGGRVPLQQQQLNKRPSLAPSNGFRRTSSNQILSGPGRDQHMSSSTLASRQPPSPQPSPLPTSASFGSGVATDFTVASRMSDASSVSTPASRGHADYFGHTTGRTSSSLANVAAAKKKPPPPPAKKFIPAAEYVVALYDFSGQGDEDLSFGEGDVIRIVKKTETDQDWWVGELKGVRGNFPANYCRPK